jgi:hypothetical protein
VSRFTSALAAVPGPPTAEETSNTRNIKDVSSLNLYNTKRALLRGAVTESVSTFTLKTRVVLDQFSGVRSQLYCHIYVCIAALQVTLL